MSAMMNSSMSSSGVYATPPDGSSAAVSSDDDSDHVNVDKLKTIRNKAAQRLVYFFKRDKMLKK